MGNSDVGGVVDWSEIAEDELVSIANRLYSVTDYFHLSQVCKAWRSINTLTRQNVLIPQPPLLMLAESKKNTTKEEDNLQTNNKTVRRGFVGLNNTNKVYELHLPELYQRRCVGSTGNWLITVNTELEINIFNPFSRTQFHLPSQSTLPDQYLFEFSDGEDDEFTQEDYTGRFLTKVVLSSPSAYINSKLDDVVAIACYGTKKRLAIARPGDESWTTIKSADILVDDVIFFKDRFYFVNRVGRVAYYDISCNPIVATHYYLVEWMGELLMVCKYFTEDELYYNTREFRVFKFNFDIKEWEEIKSLGQYSLFLGFNTSVSLLASDSSTFRCDCIYFTDDYMMGYIGTGTEGGSDMGVCDLKDGTIKPHYAGISTSLYSPPLWIIPQSLYQS
ncbi:hypothetical protein AQUCO_01600150v1 [Aquilegia coerulea]|uniref:KIB1-4 beta-propeller domain-containing protein n=1 Tax=Aquilegia coerulea TaxID=218851 RepID=A0A2G5DQC2_AQUCA|nr:hypothetical protein AQUCO_01600150v1 [Aquilegia coerulea]